MCHISLALGNTIFSFSLKHFDFLKLYELKHFSLNIFFFCYLKFSTQIEFLNFHNLCLEHSKFRSSLLNACSKFAIFWENLFFSTEIEKMKWNKIEHTLDEFSNALVSTQHITVEKHSEREWWRMCVRFLKIPHRKMLCWMCYVNGTTRSLRLRLRTSVASKKRSLRSSSALWRATCDERKLGEAKRNQATKYFH